MQDLDLVLVLVQVVVRHRGVSLLPVPIDVPPLQQAVLAAEVAPQLLLLLLLLEVAESLRGLVPLLALLARRCTPLVDLLLFPTPPPARWSVRRT